MRYAVSMKRKWSLVAVLLLGFALVPAQAGAVIAKDSTALSQVDFDATVSIKGIRNKLRQSAAAAFQKSPPEPVSVERDGVRVTVTPTVLAQRLGVSARPDGKLNVSVPIKISVDVEKSFWTATVGVKGCEPKTFTVSARFDPRIEPTGGLSFTLGDVWVRPAEYLCGLYWIVELENVATKIQRRLEALGQTAFKSRLREFNALLPKRAELLAMLKQPAVFGGAVTLGFDAPRLQITRLTSKGDVYRISGVVEGHPRLLFGDGWAADESGAGDSVAHAGFRLPARLLFPTDATLLPDVSPHKASGCLGAFRLHPVPDRRDLAILQRCGTDPVSNVIWLSGANEAPPPHVRMFNRSMTDVLTEIVTWLDDESLWRGVGDAVALRQKVQEFHELLDLFQKKTTIPVDTRGDVHFYDLNMDLIGVWVNSEAILADVMLTGKARIDVKLSL